MMSIMPCRVLKVGSSIKDMSEVHKDVATEPALMPLTGEHLHASANKANDARLDVSVRGFWQDGQRAFFDIRMFNSCTPSHLTYSPEEF